MSNEEIHVKVNAVHRLKTVIFSIDKAACESQLKPYLDELIKKEDDEVLFAIAEEIGMVFHYMPDKTMFLDLLEQLAGANETVVRMQATDSLNKICEKLSDAEVQNVYAPLIIKLAQGDWFPQRQSACQLF